MQTTIDFDRLVAAAETVKRDLLAERVPQGHWIGELATSALSTATAVSALSLVQQHTGQSFQPLIDGGVRWLAGQQNEDGGWGDTNQSYSNIATTMLVRAALHLAKRSDDHGDLLRRAERYIESKGDVAGLRKRYGRDKTFAVPILTNCALAGLADWRDVSPLPFEAACLPQSWYGALGLPVVSYAIPALVAIGQARFHHRPPRNPLAWACRRAALNGSLKTLERMQPASGGFLEAAPLTSFVVMSLASIGKADHPVAQRGVEFLVESVRPDGSWPIDTNLATWNTTLSIKALAAAGEDVAALDCLPWLLSCQCKEVHPYTGAAPGGWGWSDLSGSVPDADDTPGALLALAAWRHSPSCTTEARERIEAAARLGAGWLLGLQNADGGWPTFCRGWTKQVFDRSGADLTAHAIRALHAWREMAPAAAERAIGRGFRYLSRQQRADGSWIPLWFGNQDHPEEENPIYGTAKTLLAFRDLNRLDSAQASRGAEYLRQAQSADGSWGAGVEETALAVEALLGDSPSGEPATTIDAGLRWLVEAVEEGRHRNTSPIGFYFAKLWYYEKLYPLIFTASALGKAANMCSTPAQHANAAP